MMKRYSLLLCFLTLTAFFIAGCSKDDDPVAPGGNSYDYTSILKDYTDNVVMATYLDLKTQSAQLEAAVKVFQNEPTQANLNAAVVKWKSSRAAWEASEAFLFGPVSTLSLDPAIDTWPLDETQLAQVLANGDEITPEYVNNLDYSLKGFHTIEYFLFKNGANRDVSTLTARDIQYLVSASVVLADDAAILYAAWESGYGTEFKNAGTQASRYTSQQQAIHSIIEGIFTIADEVGNGKLGDPYSTKDTLSVESQFSWNSLTDFTNNIKSIKNAYLGGYGTDGSGLDDYVKSKNPELHTRVMSEINAAITAINNIPEPFRNNLNAGTQIEAAIEACNKLYSTFYIDVKGLVSQQ